MSRLVRFKDYKGIRTKALIFERSSMRLLCICCGQKRFGILIRHIEPRKIPDSLLCHECAVLIALGQAIKVDKNTFFGSYAPSKIIAEARRRGKQKTGRAPSEQVECPVCKRKFTKNGLRLHIIAKHPDYLPVKPQGTSGFHSAFSEQEMAAFSDNIRKEQQEKKDLKESDATEVEHKPDQKEN